MDEALKDHVEVLHDGVAFVGTLIAALRLYVGKENEVVIASSAQRPERSLIGSPEGIDARNVAPGSPGATGHCDPRRFGVLVFYAPYKNLTQSPEIE